MSVHISSSGVLVVGLSPDEVVVLRTMIDMVCRVCNDPAFGEPVHAPSDDASPEDLLAQLERAWTDVPDSEATPRDAAARRLFPDACPTDQAVSHDFRRLTLADQRLAKIMAADVVRAGLDRADARGRIRVERTEQTSWLTTITAIRIVLAARLGIDRDEDEDRLDDLDDTDPTYWMYNVYLWLAWLQESVVECLMRVAD